MMQVQNWPFANKLLAKQNVHIVGDIKDGYNPIVLEDEV